MKPEEKIMKKSLYYLQLLALMVAGALLVAACGGG